MRAAPRNRRQSGDESPQSTWLRVRPRGREIRFDPSAGLRARPWFATKFATRVGGYGFSGVGKTAYEVGKYQLFADGDQMADQGKYIVTWKQVEGKWKLHRDIWNTSLPPQKAEAKE